MAPPLFENRLLGTMGTLLGDFPGGRCQSSRPSQVEWGTSGTRAAGPLPEPRGDPPRPRPPSPPFLRPLSLPSGGPGGAVRDGPDPPAGSLRGLPDPGGAEKPGACPPHRLDLWGRQGAPGEEHVPLVTALSPRVRPFSGFRTPCW